MSENFAEMLEEYTVDINKGDIVKGEVLEITRNHVVVDIGFKSSSEISSEEFKNYNNEIEVKVGDEVDLYVKNLDNGDGEPVLSRERARTIKGWDYVQQAFDSNSDVKAVPYKEVNAGLVVDVFGVQAFMPNSLIDVKPVKDASFLLNNPVDVKVIKCNPEKGNVLVSRKATLADEDGSVEDFLENIKEGDIVSGIVKNVVHYGAFIDLGGVDGLLHVTDMSWTHVDSPDNICKLGQELDMKVINYNPEKRRISLSLKEMDTKPWDELVENYDEGDTVKGTVANIFDYGVFVNLEMNIVGLVHSSEISWKARDPNPEKFYSIGDTIESKILEIDHEKRKVSLSIKRTEDNPWELFAENNKIGEKVSATVRSVTDHGIFVDFQEGVSGIVPQEEVSWSPEKKDQKVSFTQGDTIDVIVKEVDVESEKIKVSLRELKSDPLESFIQENKGKPVSGVVEKVSDKDITVKLDDELYGYINHEEAGIGDQKLRDFYSDGEEVKATVLGKTQRYAKLSLKALAS